MAGERESFFSVENVAKAESEVRAWIAKHPEAAKELGNIWRGNVPTAGHKSMARLLAKEAK